MFNSVSDLKIGERVQSKIHGEYGKVVGFHFTDSHMFYDVRFDGYSEHSYAPWCSRESLTRVSDITELDAFSCWLQGGIYTEISVNELSQLPDGSLLQMVSDKSTSKDTHTLFVSTISGVRVFVEPDGMQLDSRAIARLSRGNSFKVLYLA